MIYTCCDENRRTAVAQHAILNGIDWLEVLDRDAPADSPRQRTLMVRLLKAAPVGHLSLGQNNVRIEGGERVCNIRVEWVAVAASPPANQTTTAEQTLFTALDQAAHVLLVRTDSEGDYSTYRLRLVRGEDDGRPPENFDPRLAEVDFSFKVECPSDFDCKPNRVCPESPETVPDIDYLAKDYGSFRQLMLDRLSQLVPDWRERSAADLTVTLTEALAYVADHLSYWQDAIATEAYLETARRRTSLRRHALLVDYHLHDGCNARAWLYIKVEGGPFSLDKNSVRFFTRVAGSPRGMVPDSREEQEALRRLPEVFEPMHDATLQKTHNELRFYTWGDQRCCLPKGATRATLRDHYPNLVVGDVLIFQEEQGPLTGIAEDADPRHRHAVRLTSVQAFDGAAPLVDPLNGQPITEIFWHQADALPFPLCLSAWTDEAHGSKPIEDVSVALGNIVLIDHGRTVTEQADKDLGAVPPSRLYYPPDRDAEHCQPKEPAPVPPRYRPRLPVGPLTRTGTVLKTFVESGVRRTRRLAFDPDTAAADAMRWQMADVLPTVVLNNKTWEARRDLLDSKPTDEHFVVESEHDGTAWLRFGDDRHGKRPDSGTTFTASYRVGNGPAGNVGAETIAHVVSNDGRIQSVINPMAARGGVEAESAAQVRRHAPQAFRTQERAVTPADYAKITERHAGVQRAAATQRWTGSWHTVFITVDREGGELLDPPYTADLYGHVDRYRMAGHDLHFNDPIFVSLEMDLRVCVAPDYFRRSVRAALLVVLSNSTLPDGRRGVFHPDNLSFGQMIYLSPIYAAARQVPGVASVQITRFHRQGREDPKPLADGFLRLGRLEIPRLDNDPNFPEHGVLRLALFGGK